MISVLLVDDESLLLGISTLYLERTGEFAIETALSASAALEKIRNHHYDAIVSDYQMPGMDGIQFLKDLRSSGDTTPFIIFTGKGREDVVIQAFNEGADFYIQKGGEPKSQFTELAHKIRQAVELRREERARKESEDNYRLLFDNATEGILIAQGSRLVFVNPMLVTIFGYPQETLTSRPFTDFLHPDDREKVLDRHLRRMQGEEVPTGYQFRIVRPDGSERWVEITSKRIVWGGSPASLSFLIDVTERKQSEEAVRRSQKELELTLAATTEGIWKWDFTTDTIEFSPRYYQMLGYEPGAFSMSFASWQELIHPDDRKQALAVAEAYLAGKPDTYENEFRLRTKSGTYRWIHASARVVERDANGTALRVIGNHQDITAWKEVVEALRRSEEKYREIYDNSVVGFFQTAPDGNLLSANRAYATMYGYSSPEEIVATITNIGLQLYTNPAERADILRELKETGLLAPREAQVRHKDGHTFWVLLMARSVLDAQGNLSCLEGTSVDITARKKTEEALRRSEALYRSMLNACPDVITITDMEGVVTIVSPASLMLFGYDREDQVLGRPASSFLVPEDRARFILTIRRMHEGMYEGPEEYRALRADGTVIDIEANGDFVRDAAGNPVGMIYVIRDITGRKRSEAQVRLNNIRTQILLELYRMKEAPNPDLYHFTLESSLKVTESQYSFIGMINADESVMTIHAWSPGAMKECAIAKKPMQFPISTAGIWADCVRTRSAVVINDYISYPAKRGVPEGHVPITRFLGVPVFDSTRIVAVVAVANKTKDYTEDDIDALSTLGNTMWELMHRRESEDRIRWLASFPEMNPNAVIELDATGVVTYANTATRRQLLAMGLPEDPRLFLPGDMDEILGLLRETTDQQVSREITLKDHVFSENIALNPGLQVVRIYVLDVTGLHQVEEALQTANKKLSLLGSATRHDISNQMMVVTGYLDLVREQVTDPALTPYFTRIEHATGRIEALIRFSKAYEQIGAQTPLWQDCRALVESAIIEASIGHLTLKNELPAGVEIRADPLISRALYNLIDNAMRHGGTLTTIRFTGNEQDEAFHITCEDDGMGIAPAEKEKIFERGYGKNTGLGLFLAREILAITGITIAETGEQGKGARFVIIVPQGAWHVRAGDE